jgi:hypothetical protein
MSEISKNSHPDFARFTVPRKEVDTLFRKLVKLLAGLSSGPRRQQQFDGRLLDENREDIYALMQQQMSSLR